MTYEQLCRGEEFITEEQRSELLCRYSTGQHPYLTIGPVKEEEIYLDPRIVIFHDIVSDSELDTVKSLSAPLLERAAVFDPETKDRKFADYRYFFPIQMGREEDIAKEIFTSIS